VPVDKQSDKYFKYTKNDWLRDEAQVRADGTESVGSGYNITTDTYYADVYAIHKDVGDQTRANADAPINVDREAAEFVTHRLLTRREIQFVNDFMKGGVWGSTASGVSSASPTAGQFTQWSDYTNSDPIEDIEEGKASILSVTGFEANTLVLGYDVFRQLKNHPDLVDRIKYSSSQTITEDMLARMFDIERVLTYVGESDGAAATGSVDPVGWLHDAVEWRVAGSRCNDRNFFVPFGVTEGYPYRG